MRVIERENACSNGKKPKYIVPSEFNFEEVRDLFKKPSILDIEDVN